MSLVWVDQYQQRQEMRWCEYFTSDAPDIPGSEGVLLGWLEYCFFHWGYVHLFPYMASLDAFLTFHEEKVQALHSTFWGKRAWKNKCR